MNLKSSAALWVLFSFRDSLRRDWEMRKMHKNVWLGNLKETDHFENLVVDGNFIVNLYPANVENRVSS
jgi:hypothetical protein